MENHDESDVSDGGERPVIALKGPGVWGAQAEGAAGVQPNFQHFHWPSPCSLHPCSPRLHPRIDIDPIRCWRSTTTTAKGLNFETSRFVVKVV